MYLLTFFHSEVLTMGQEVGLFTLLALIIFTAVFRKKIMNTAIDVAAEMQLQHLTTTSPFVSNGDREVPPIDPGRWRKDPLDENKFINISNPNFFVYFRDMDDGTYMVKTGALHRLNAEARVNLINQVDQLVDVDISNNSHLIMMLRNAEDWNNTNVKEIIAYYLFKHLHQAYTV